jgi:ferrous-iron efflux pump FieF
MIEAIRRIANPEPIQSTTTGIVIMVISTMIILTLLAYQQHVIRRTNSMSIKADFLHYLNDMVVNGLVIFSLVLCCTLNYHWIDGVASIVIALYILFAAFCLGRDAAGELMDLELNDDARQKILKIIRATPLVSGVHDLRSRRSGPDVFIEAHVEMPANMTLHDAHEVTDQLEHALKVEFPNAHITLHQEPEGIADHRLDEIIKS